MAGFIDCSSFWLDGLDSFRWEVIGKGFLKIGLWFGISIVNNWSKNERVAQWRCSSVSHEWGRKIIVELADEEKDEEDEVKPIILTFKTNIYIYIIIHYLK